MSQILINVQCEHQQSLYTVNIHYTYSGCGQKFYENRGYNGYYD